MNPTTLLSRLRSAGISIELRDCDLVVRAPKGVVTPKLHAKLVKQKRALVAAIREEALGLDLAATDALVVISELLASAYRRYCAVQRVGSDESKEPVNEALANSSPQSGHGVVP